MCRQSAIDELGSRVRAARQKAGLSQRQLERLAHLTDGHVKHIESGRTRVLVSTASALACALGLPLDWLICGRGQAPSSRTIRAAARAAEAWSTDDET